jgi:phospholipid/cholesterol/gamma-HCH transport system permease protein
VLDARILRLALVIGAAFGIGIGCVEAIQFGFGLQRFGGLEYVPRVVVLSLVRADGPAIALSAVCYAALFVFHRSRADVPAAAAARARTGLFVAGGVLVVSPLATVLGTMASALTLAAVYGHGVAAFAASVRETLLWSDVVAGIVLTAAYAAAAGLFVPRLAPRLGRAKLHFALKLVIVSVVLFGVHLFEAAIRTWLHRH